MFEIFHEINVIIPGGLIIGFAFVVLFVRAAEAAGAARYRGRLLPSQPNETRTA